MHILRCRKCLVVGCITIDRLTVRLDELVSMVVCPPGGSVASVHTIFAIRFVQKTGVLGYSRGAAQMHFGSFSNGEPILCLQFDPKSFNRVMEPLGAAVGGVCSSRYPHC